MGGSHGTIIFNASFLLKLFFVKMTNLSLNISNYYICDVLMCVTC